MGKTIGSIVLTALLLLGCAAAIMHQRQSFEPAVEDYMQRLRWKDWNGAGRYFPEKERALFLQQMLATAGLHVTDVRLEGVDSPANGTQAVTRMAVEYYLLPSATVKTMRVRQEWIYTEGDRAHPPGWQVLTLLPPLQ